MKDGTLDSAEISDWRKELEKYVSENPDFLIDPAFRLFFNSLFDCPLKYHTSIVFENGVVVGIYEFQKDMTYHEVASCLVKHKMYKEFSTYNVSQIATEVHREMSKIVVVEKDTHVLLKDKGRELGYKLVIRCDGCAEIEPQHITGIFTKGDFIVL